MKLIDIQMDLDNDPLTMRLLEHDAWKVREAPSVYEDLPGPLDGRVAAYFEMARSSYFVTTNTCYVPLLPETDSQKIVVRRDLRFGPDDPVLWPRLYSDRFCHLAAIPKAPIDQDELRVILAEAWFSEFAVLTGSLIDEYEQYGKTLPTGARPPLLLPQLVQRLPLSLERLRIPSTYIRMVIFWKVCLPCWLIRPLKAFANEYILKVVVPFAATNFLEMKPAAGFSPVPTTDRLDDRISLVHRCTENTLWYRNLFEDTSPDAASTSAARSSRAGTAGEQSAKAGPSRNVSSAPSSRKGPPYAAARAQAKAQKEAKGPNHNAKPPRDKYLPFDRPEMPTTITSWATALAAIDRSHPPSCGIDLPQLYVMPEPALLASPEEEPRRRMLYHNYRLLRDALTFHLADRSQRHAMLTTQQWRDILQGKDGTRAQARSTSLEDLLPSLLSAPAVSTL
ncbi:hypothetical protein FB451DRAFT_1388258 [Mycena latifolia]|nr:hypothetical protein FB451DRAFT_1388258 [Mycena latifolia]